MVLARCDHAFPARNQCACKKCHDDHKYDGNELGAWSHLRSDFLASHLPSIDKFATIL